MENKYIAELKKIILDDLQNENVKIILYGSRARGDNHYTADVDIGFIPREKFNTIKITLLREKLENSNIPYKVDIVNLNTVSADFKNEIMKDAIVWKD